MKDQVEALKKYHRYTNYMSAAMLYLKDNFELKHKLTHDHIKHRILGHWGTVPGLNFIYGGLNSFIKNDLDKDLNVMLIAGPGHGAPAILSGLYLDEALRKYYSEATLDLKGFEYMIRYFSWPQGFPSHTYPGLPGQIHEGGELGYSLGTAFGTVFDRPDLLTVCIVGDGEAETGTLSASWQSNKFLNHKNDGVVLPILHLNSYKISGPTLFACMTDKEINQYFSGLGYDPIFVDQYKLEDEIYEEWLKTLKVVNTKINKYRKYGGELPLIILKTMKGWTGPEFNGDKKIEDNNLSHGIPLKLPKTDKDELEILKNWLQSYKIDELLEKDGAPVKEILDLLPDEERRIGNNKYANGDPGKVKLILPDLGDHQEIIKTRGQQPESGMVEIAEYFKDVLILNRDEKNFRVFSPDESESNFLEPIFEETCRVCSRDHREHDKYYSRDGRMLEILSENVLQAWMEGYVKTGRHGVLVSYEAFLGIINSQIDQYLKYLKQSSRFYWRKPLASLNYIATSTSWRQDHNGFSHQNPSLINTLITKQSDNTSVYFPVDVNTLLVSMEECMKKVDSVNLIVSGKTDLPQWLNLEEAREHVKNGISIWDWAGNTKNMAGEVDSREDHVDVVLSSAGDYQTRETLAACKILKEEVPELRFQYVNVNEITRLGLGDENNPVMTQQDVNKYYTKTKPVIFNFHGYPEVIKSLTWGTSLANRMVILGYIEEGSTTTAFDMQVVNKTSRYHVCIQAVLAASKSNKIVDHHAERLIQKWQKILDDHDKYIFENADDMPIVKDFDFSF